MQQSSNLNRLQNIGKASRDQSKLERKMFRESKNDQTFREKQKQINKNKKDNIQETRQNKRDNIKDIERKKDDNIDELNEQLKTDSIDSSSSSGIDGLKLALIDATSKALREERDARKEDKNGQNKNDWD